MEKTGDFVCGMVVDARWTEFFRTLLGFPRTTISRVCREWSEKESMRKYPVSGSSVGKEIPLLMPEERREWSNWFELIKRQQ